MPQIVPPCGKLRYKPETKKQANLSGKNPHNPLKMCLTKSKHNNKKFKEMGFAGNLQMCA
jgi:hypothetical protein